MASSDSEFEADLEEQAKSLTTCSICMDRFTCPKVLPCQHTFCLSCLKRCHECTNSQRLVPVSNFPCPTCRKVCYVPPGGLEQLATDFRIGQILDLMAAIESSIQSQQKNKSTVPGFGRCSICCFQKREKTANSFCLQCEKAFCSQCLSHHAKTRIFRDHVIINDNLSNEGLRQNSDKCLEHEAHYKYFCEDCSVLLCTVCLFTEHDDHSVLEKDKAANDLERKLNKFSEDLGSRVSKLNELKVKICDLKKFVVANKESFEAEVCSSYEESLKNLEQLKMQILSDAAQSFENSLMELEDANKSIVVQHSVVQEKYDSIMAIMAEKGSCKFFLEFKPITEALGKMPETEPKALNIEMIKFLPSLDVSLGSIDRIKKTLDVAAADVASLMEEGACKDVNLKEQENKNPEKTKKSIPIISHGKPMKVTRLQVSVQNGSNDKINNNEKVNNSIKKDSLKPSSSDKVIQGLGRRLSGRLSLATFQQSNLVGATALSPVKRKMNWIAEGFSQCRDCCFLKMHQQWMVAACDYRATNAGDRIKIFDLKGRQQGVINVRAIVEPWALTYQKSSHTFMVTDHSSRAIKMINLDENGRCSKVSTMYQSYAEKPTGISTTSSGSFVVTDIGLRQHRLAIYTTNSHYLERKMLFGKTGNTDGEVLFSNYVVADGNNRAVVSDIEANNIKVFSLLDGRQLLKFSCSCSFDGGKEMEPQGVAVDDANNILVADQATNSVVMFSSEGQLIGSVACCKGRPWGISYADEMRVLAVATDKGLEVFEL